MAIHLWAGLVLFLVAVVCLAAAEVLRATSTSPSARPVPSHLELTGARKAIQTFLFVSVAWLGALSLLHVPADLPSLVIAVSAFGVAAFGLGRRTYSAHRVAGAALVALDFLCVVELHARRTVRSWDEPAWKDVLAFDALAILFAAGPVLVTVQGALYALEHRRRLRAGRLPAAMLRPPRSVR
jgi:hypothetical protein